MSASTADISREHLLVLKVMRLTKPTFNQANPVYTDGRDTNSTEDPFQRMNSTDVNMISSLPFETNSPALLLPQNFGTIFLGETFSCYISIHNSSQSVCKNVSLKAELQTTSNRLAVNTVRSQAVAEVPPVQSIDDIIHHEVKEMGTHILVCTVYYTAPNGSRNEFRKFFKFQVLKPLDVKTKFLNAENSDVYLEAQIQNITSNGIYLDRVVLEPSQHFNCEDLSEDILSDPMNRYVNQLDGFQFLFRLTPKPGLAENHKVMKSVTSMGRLDIQWRGSMGERGRLQTSPLQRVVPGYGDIRLVVKSMPSRSTLETPVDITYQLINCTERQANLRIELKNTPSCGILWTGISGRQIGTLGPNQSITMHYQFIPIRPGLQTVSGIRVIDTTSRRTHEYDEIAHIFVENPAPED